MKRFTKREDKVLRKLYKEGISAKKIAEALNKTVSVVRVD